MRSRIMLMHLRQIMPRHVDEKLRNAETARMTHTPDVLPRGPGWAMEDELPSMKQVSNN
jgi:hypothetical protein